MLATGVGYPYVTYVYASLPTPRFILLSSFCSCTLMCEIFILYIIHAANVTPPPTLPSFGVDSVEECNASVQDSEPGADVDGSSSGDESLDILLKAVSSYNELVLFCCFSQKAMKYGMMMM